MDTARKLELIALPGIPMVSAGDDVTTLILDGVAAAGTAIEDGDILVIAQKIISKTEGRIVDLGQVSPSSRAEELAVLTDKDPRLVEVILGESSEVVRHRPGVLVVEHRLGVVLANAGIDRSNVESDGDEENVLLLPEDPDASSKRIGEEIASRTGCRVAIIVNDSLGRAWRQGTCGVAIGAWGLSTLSDLRGRKDLYDRPLEVTQEAIADELAAAASLLQGQADEGMPVVLVRGLAAARGEDGSDEGAPALIRSKDEDLFR
jgi:coenzyme F420-0:L-glutamate ligase/coenzyme F420-1:gamma-L-glutamate ligase